MSNDLLKKRDESIKKRKERKKQMDALIELSKEDDSKGKIILSANVATVTDTNKTARLLDEGFCDNGFVLKKGTLEKFLNGENEHLDNLTDDFVGTVNLGHKNFATDPYILGEFTKADLTLVDIENDRKALDVNVRLDEDSMFVKELRRQPYDIGISAEFYYHIDWESTSKLVKEFGMDMPVFDEVFISAYGLVGDCGNVNSSGLELKGDFMKKDELKELIEIEKTDEEKEELGVEEVDITETEETEEDAAEETAAVEEAEVEADEADEEEAEEEESEEDAEGEEDTDEEAEEGDEDGDEEAEEESEEELSIVDRLREHIQTLEATVAELTEANAKLKKTNRKLNSKYQNELDKKEKFKESLKGLSVELLPDEEKKPQEEKKNAVDKNYIRSGIGEI